MPKDSGEGFAPCAAGDALDWSEGTYTLVRLSRIKYRDKTDVLAKINELYPGCTLGPMMAHVKFWVWKIKLKKE